MRGWRRSVGIVSQIVLAATLALGEGSAAAQRRPRDPVEKKPEATAPLPAEVEIAEQQYAKLDYDRANDVAARVVKERNLTHDQLVRAYRVLAVTHAILDKEEAAREAFLQLLVLDPEYAVDQNLGPKVSAPFVEARGHFRSLASRPGVDVVANVREQGGRLRVVTRDPTHIAKKVTVAYRWSSNGEYTTAQVGVGESGMDVVAAPKGRRRLDFYAQVTDDRDNVVFEAGSPDAPKSAFVEGGRRAAAAPPENKTIFASPVFWLVTGALVAGAGTALFFTLRPDGPATEASLSPVIRCGDAPCR